jgi:hypothetical protein
LVLCKPMSVTIDLGETALFHQGLPKQVSDWLTWNIGPVYHTDEIWRHNEHVLESKLGRSKSLSAVLVNIQAQHSHAHECGTMMVVHACGWNFTSKRRFATGTDTIAVTHFHSSLLRIEDADNALRFVIKWMQ